MLESAKIAHEREKISLFLSLELSLASSAC